MKAMNLTKTETAIRLLLGMLFLSTGVMKFFVPDLRAAFSGQLATTSIPFHSFNMWAVPAAEIALGALFMLGLLPRLAGLTAIALMAVATYVHLVVSDPTLFPLQPKQPIIPIVVIAISITLLWIKRGLWNVGLSGNASTGKQPAGDDAIAQCE